MVGLSAALWQAQETPAPAPYRTLAADGRTVFLVGDPITMTAADVVAVCGAAAGAQVVSRGRAHGKGANMTASTVVKANIDGMAKWAKR